MSPVRATGQLRTQEQFAAKAEQDRKQRGFRRVVRALRERSEFADQVAEEIIKEREWYRGKQELLFAAGMTRALSILRSAARREKEGEK